jgi:hypothetical protein
VTRRLAIRFGIWIVCLGTAAYLAALVRALLGKGPWQQAFMNPFGALRLETREFGRSHSARARRRRRLQQSVRKAQGFVLEVGTGLVHWVQPAAYKLRTGNISGKTEILPRERILGLIQTHGETGCPGPNDAFTRRPLSAQDSVASQPHFDPKRAPIIHESLALAALSMADPRGPITGVQRAKEILLPLLRSSRYRCNWRVFEIYGRLCCIDPTNRGARAAFEDFKRNAPGLQKTDLPERMVWLVEAKQFAKFYGKSNDLKHATFRRRLQSRIAHAKVLLEGDSSSSGKDSAPRAEGGSNPPNSPSSLKFRSNTPPKERLHGSPSSSPRKRKKTCLPCATVTKSRAGAA